MSKRYKLVIDKNAIPGITDEECDQIRAKTDALVAYLEGLTHSAPFVFQIVEKTPDEV